MRTIIFWDRPDIVESKMNEWFEKNDVTVIQMQQSIETIQVNETSALIVTIIYIFN